MRERVEMDVRKRYERSGNIPPPAATASGIAEFRGSRCLTKALTLPVGFDILSDGEGLTTVDLSSPEVAIRNFHRQSGYATSEETPKTQRERCLVGMSSC